jgi:large subunit ribosomal protein L21e
MVTRKGGNRRGTRYFMSKSSDLKGKISLRRFLQTFKPGDKVALKAESSVHQGLYFKRFHGKICVVSKQRGFSYEVQLKDGSKTKTLIVHPVHMRKI